MKRDEEIKTSNFFEILELDKKLLMGSRRLYQIWEFYFKKKLISLVYTPKQRKKIKKIKVKLKKDVDKRRMKNSNEFDGNMYHHYFHISDTIDKSSTTFFIQQKHLEQNDERIFPIGTFARTINIKTEFINFQFPLHLEEEIKSMNLLSRQFLGKGPIVSMFFSAFYRS